jgi:hypothetical protein
VARKITGLPRDAAFGGILRGGPNLIENLKN